MRSTSASTGDSQSGDSDSLRGCPACGVPDEPQFTLTARAFWRRPCQAMRCRVQIKTLYADRGLIQSAILGLMRLNFLSVVIRRFARSDGVGFKVRVRYRAGFGWLAMTIDRKSTR